MEVDDERLADGRGRARRPMAAGDVDRRRYFDELFRLQGELVKLQDWIVDQKLKVVVCSRAATPPARAA